jgi:hypothetical protein
MKRGRKQLVTFYVVRDSKGVARYVGRTIRSISKREKEHRGKKSSPIYDLLNSEDCSFSLLAEIELNTLSEIDIIEDAFTILLRTQKKDGGFNVLNSSIKNKYRYSKG